MTLCDCGNPVSPARDKWTNTADSEDRLAHSCPPSRKQETMPDSPTHQSVLEKYGTLAVAPGREGVGAIAAPARCSHLSAVSTTVGLTTHGHYGGRSICRRDGAKTVRQNLLCSLCALDAGWFQHFKLK